MLEFLHFILSKLPPGASFSIIRHNDIPSFKIKIMNEEVDFNWILTDDNTLNKIAIGEAINLLLEKIK